MESLPTLPAFIPAIVVAVRQLVSSSDVSRSASLPGSVHCALFSCAFLSSSPSLASVPSTHDFESVELVRERHKH